MYSAVRVGESGSTSRPGPGRRWSGPRAGWRSTPSTSSPSRPPGDGLARARFAVRCGRGPTSGRSPRLGQALSVPAHRRAPPDRRRPVHLATARPLAEVERLAVDAPADLAARMVRPADALRAFPAVMMAPEEVRALCQGKIRGRPRPPCAGPWTPREPSWPWWRRCREGLKPVRVLVAPWKSRGQAPPSVDFPPLCR